MGYEHTPLAWRWRIALRHPERNLVDGTARDGRAWPSVT